LLQPILPVQILWINLIVAVALALPLAFETSEPEIMARPPRKKAEPIFNRFILVRTFTVSLLMAIGAVGLFLWKYDLEVSQGAVEKVAIAQAQTITVTAMVLFQIFYLFHCRSFKRSVLKTVFASNPSIWIGVGSVLAAQLAFIYLPWMNRLFHSLSLNGTAWLISIGAALAISTLVACEQALSRRLWQQV
jgi:magnesium-transporting ATPase (P-type)